VRFEHRATDADPRILDRVWRTRTDTHATMTSAARTSFHLIIARTRGRMTAGLRGPETRATTAPVPAPTEYLGVRFALGVVLRPHPAATMVDGYAPLPVTDGGLIVLGGEEWEAPTFENIEQFVRRLRNAGLLVPSTLDREPHPVRGGSQRSWQRRYRAFTGMPRTTVAQIDRANVAATMLRAGDGWATVVDALGFFDQAHLAHALRRFVGRTARELQVGDPAPMSFLYKTGSGTGS
jgi:hypothetical protein